MHRGALTFANDLWDGTHATDRDLYIKGIEVNGRHFDGSAATNSAGDPNDGHVAQLWHNGSVTFEIDAATTGGGTGAGAGAGTSADTGGGSTGPTGGSAGGSAAGTGTGTAPGTATMEWS